MTRAFLLAAGFRDFEEERGGPASAVDAEPRKGAQEKTRGRRVAQ